ncbi:ATP-dependent 6-phosphofructokinase [Fibrobacterales bacterium]|nr:ATP-dependent 6-phosphofructokinase [Fibrobacterales bacterium]
MSLKIGILTSGGDCAGLNAVIRAFGKTIFALDKEVELFGIENGYAGLASADYHKMSAKEFSGILNIGGTILGTSRTPFKKLLTETEKIDAMKSNYKKMNLDALVVLGGAGTHKTANLLSEKGLNVLGVPKTIDNDIFGTDVTFGFHTAVDVATECIERLNTTAASHHRVMLVEIMGNKTGWLSLYSGIAGGAEIILLPEIPYDIEKVIKAADYSCKNKNKFCMMVVAEGAMSKIEAEMSKKDREKARAELGATGNAATQIAKILERELQKEVRLVVPGHIQRGGNPCAYDRVLCTHFGSFAAQTVYEGKFGNTVAMVDNKLVLNKLGDIAGKLKFVPENHDLIKSSKAIGVSFGA